MWGLVRLLPYAYIDARANVRSILIFIGRVYHRRMLRRVRIWVNVYESPFPLLRMCIYLSLQVSQIYGASNPIYANAYWQIKYIRTFTAAADVASSATSSAATNPPPVSSPDAVTQTETSTTTVDPVETGGSGDTLGSGPGSGAVSMIVGLRGGWLWVVVAGVMAATVAL
jgi:hypothetical protein